MGVPERRARQKEELRQEILDAARELFYTESYDSFSMCKPAEHIEYSPTIIYLHFKDKAELFDSLQKHMHRRAGRAGGYQSFGNAC